jgi:hypothetical protein
MGLFPYLFSGRASHRFCWIHKLSGFSGIPGPLALRQDGQSEQRTH